MKRCTRHISYHNFHTRRIHLVHRIHHSNHSYHHPIFHMSSSATSVSLTSTPSLDPSILANEHRADLTKAEYFDILTEDGKSTGRTKLRNEVHRDGDWHASVHIWILNNQTGQILVQKRASCKDSFPSCWDVSCAGHLSAGETVESAVEAELSEELGILRPKEIEFNKFFTQLPTLSRSIISQGGKFIDNEHTYIYLIEGNWKLDELRLQKEEVEAVEWVELEDLITNLAKCSPGYVLISDLDSYTQNVFDHIRKRIQQIRERGGDGTSKDTSAAQ